MESLKNKIRSVLQQLDERAEVTDFLKKDAEYKEEIEEKLKGIEEIFEDESTEVTIEVKEKGGGVFEVVTNVRSATKKAANERLKDIRSVIASRIGEKKKDHLLDKSKYFKLQNGYRTIEAANNAAANIELRIHQLIKDYKMKMEEEVEDIDNKFLLNVSFAIHEYERENTEGKRLFFELVIDGEILYNSSYEDKLQLKNLVREISRIQVEAEQMHDSIRTTMLFMMHQSSKYVTTHEKKDVRYEFYEQVSKMTTRKEKEDVFKTILASLLLTHHAYDPSFVRLGYDEENDSFFITGLSEDIEERVEDKYKFSSRLEMMKTNISKFLSVLGMMFEEELKYLLSSSIDEQIKKSEDVVRLLRSEFEGTIEKIAEMRAEGKLDEKKKYFLLLKSKREVLSSFWNEEEMNLLTNELLRSKGRIGHVLGRKVEPKDVKNSVYFRFVKREGSGNIEEELKLTEEMMKKITTNYKKVDNTFRANLFEVILSTPQIHQVKKKYKDYELFITSDSKDTQRIVENTLETYEKKVEEKDND